MQCGVITVKNLFYLLLHLHPRPWVMLRWWWLVLMYDLISLKKIFFTVLLPIPNPIPPPNFSAPSFTPDHLLVKPQQISASWFISILSSTSSFARCSYGVRKNPAIRKCEISKLMLAFFCLQRGKRFFIIMIIMITNINNTRLMCICTNFFFLFYPDVVLKSNFFFILFIIGGYTQVLSIQS